VIHGPVIHRGVVDAASTVVVTLKRHERANRLERFGILRDQAELTAARKVPVQVFDLLTPCRHYRSTRHLSVVHEGWGAEVARLERSLDLVKVASYLRDRLTVVRVVLKLDAPPVGKRVEEVRRGVLVDAHASGVGTALLERREARVPGRLLSVGTRRRQSECRREHGGGSHEAISDHAEHESILLCEERSNAAPSTAEAPAALNRLL
jgi:hypothetical protein